MDFETQSEKKKYKAGVFGDVYGIMMLPKELELEKEVVASPLELRFQLPDFRTAIQVNIYIFLWDWLVFGVWLVRKWGNGKGYFFGLINDDRESKTFSQN